MQTQIQIYQNSDFGEVRTKVIDGKPYFCLADVCRVLDIKNSRDLKTRLDERGVAITDALTSGGTQQMTFIDEGNLYRAIFQSRKPEAERFTEWVTRDVLPEIRRTGGYNLPGNYVAALRELADTTERLEQLVIENAKMLPKAEYFDELVDRNLLTNFRDTAKELKIGERKFIAFLIDKNYIYRDQRGKLRPYAKKGEGLFELKEFSSRYSDHSDLQTLVTPRGRETFRLLLENIGKERPNDNKKQTA